MLPILHLNGFKIGNPTIFSRISREEAEMFFGGGWEPRFVEGDEPEQMHQKMAAALDWAVREIQRVQEYARTTGDAARPRWPMIVFRSPKGWTGPKEVDGQPVEGSWRSHQIPIPVHDGKPGRVQELERWLSYRPEGSLTRTAPSSPSSRPSPPKGTGAWAPIPTPAAGCSCGTCAPPTSGSTRCPSPGPARWRRRTPPCWEIMCRTCCA